MAKLPLPPGPKPLPVIGNLLEIPGEFSWETYDKWFKEFQSDVVHIDAAGSPIVIVNTYEAAIELFERRSALYSSRVRLPMANELMGWEFSFSLLRYGDKWRSYRRRFHQAFNVNTSKHFEPRQLKATHQLLVRIMDRPADANLIGHFRHMTASVIIDIVYGIKILPDNDPYVDLVDKAMRAFGIATTPGRFWVDLLPWLKYVPKWVPGAGFQRQAEQWAEYTKEMVDKPFESTKRSIKEGRFTPSFISQSLENLSPDAPMYHGEKAIKDVGAIAFAGGADTTVSALGTFALAMLQYPDVQKKAQAELDNVLNGHLPTFIDQDSLPYTTAVVYETLRWKAVTPMAAPHCLTSDDVYKGYRLPAGSMVVPNVWSMLYDDEMYPNPTTFNPERFLKDGRLDPSVRDPSLMAFGFGRRICPGRYMAYSSLWITVASMLATMEIRKPLDELGNVIEPSGEYISGLIQTPKPFACCVRPRSKNAESLVRSAVLSEA